MIVNDLFGNTGEFDDDAYVKLYNESTPEEVLEYFEILLTASRTTMGKKILLLKISEEEYQEVIDELETFIKEMKGE